MQDLPMYLEFMRQLEGKKVRYVLCGGLALVLRHIKRDTYDANIVVALDEDNVTRFLDAIEETGWQPRAPVPSRDFLNPEKRKSWIEEKHAKVFTFIHPEKTFLSIDVFLALPLTEEKLFGEATHIGCAGVRVPVASYRALLDMKKKIVPIRAKDAIDIIILERILDKQKDS